MDFEQWLADFSKDKKEVGTVHVSTDAVHSVRRYLDKNNQLFEIGLTYTNVLVTRLGVIAEDGVTVGWSAWKTLHQVEMPKR